jgi:hypothetical protein
MLGGQAMTGAERPALEVDEDAVRPRKHHAAMVPTLGSWLSAGMSA